MGEQKEFFCFNCRKYKMPTSDIVYRKGKHRICEGCHAKRVAITGKANGVVRPKPKAPKIYAQHQAQYLTAKSFPWAR